MNNQSKIKNQKSKILLALLVSWWFLLATPAQAYIEAFYPLGRVIRESTTILVLRVEKVDTEKNLIYYRKVREVKGSYPADVVRHNIGHNGFNPREWQNIMKWASEGKTALFFFAGGASETCIDGYWYQAYGSGEWWSLSHAEPFLTRSYCGSPEKCATAVAAMMKGETVIIPARADGDKEALHLRTAKPMRIKANLNMMDFNQTRDFVGWGADDFRPLLGMPGFNQYGPIPRTDPDAGGIAVADFNGDGKPDLCIYGGARTAVLMNEGSAFGEISLPYTGPARAAAWADVNGDGKPDLLLATPTGPKLLVYAGNNTFRDESAALPKEPYYNLTAGAFIDTDGKGHPDILLANGFLGLRLYRNTTPAPTDKVPNPPLTFEDVSDKVGLGRNGIAWNLKGDHLLVGDFEGAGRPGFLYSAGTGVLVRNTPQGFVYVADAGISYQSGGIMPVFADLFGKGRLDLFVPQNGVCKLYYNEGKGRFYDATAKAGDLRLPVGDARCATVADFDGTGHPDLFLGCIKGPNRFFHNTGNGTFRDATTEIGLDQAIFNTVAILATDLNKDGAPDLIMNNEGRESAILLANPTRK